MPFCISCRKPLPEGARFCDFCGASQTGHSPIADDSKRARNTTPLPKKSGWSSLIVSMGVAVIGFAVIFVMGGPDWYWIAFFLVVFLGIPLILGGIKSSRVDSRPLRTLAIYYGIALPIVFGLFWFVQSSYDSNFVRSHIRIGLANVEVRGVSSDTATLVVTFCGYYLFYPPTNPDYLRVHGNGIPSHKDYTVDQIKFRLYQGSDYLGEGTTSRLVPENDVAYSGYAGCPGSRVSSVITTPYSPSLEPALEQIRLKRNDVVNVEGTAEILGKEIQFTDRWTQPPDGACVPGQYPTCLISGNEWSWYKCGTGGSWSYCGDGNYGGGNCQAFPPDCVR